MEILIAAFVPPLAAILIAHFIGGDFRRAVRWFAVLALMWFAPCWMTGRSPAPFDYLAEDVPPWQQRGYVSGNALLSDATLQFLPWREVVRDSILHGSMPFLDRYAACGSPLWENPQAQAAFPLTWIGIAFSTFAWPLFAAMTKVLAAMCGTYLFLRARVTSHGAAIAAPLAYGFGAFNIAFILFPHTNVTALLPFVLLAIETSNAPMFAIALALMLVGGHPESVLHCAVVALPYAIAKKRLVPMILAGVCALLLAAPAILPFAKYLPMSERVARLRVQKEILATPPATFANLSAFITIAHLGNTRNPNLLMNFNEVATQYTGVLTFLLALAAAIFDAKRQRFWIAVFLVAAFLAFDSPVERVITSHIPIVNGRLRFVAAFAMCVLAASAIDRFIRADRWRIAVAVVIYADLATMLIAYNPPTSRAFFYPPALSLPPGRVASVGNALRPNTAAMLRREDIGFHDPMAFAPYAELLSSVGYDRHTYFNFFPALPPRPLLDFLGVHSVVLPNGNVIANPNAKARAFAMTPGATVTMTSYESNRETFIVQAVGRARVATSEVALPGWRLRREGERWPIVKLRGVFIGFEAPPGRSAFELIYAPEGFGVGLALFAVGVGLLVVLVRFRNNPALA